MANRKHRNEKKERNRKARRDKQVRAKSEPIESIAHKMIYATVLADSPLIYEEMFLLTGLCDEVAQLRELGQRAEPAVEAAFFDSITLRFRTDGQFRSEVDRLSLIKPQSLIKNLFQPR